MKQKMGDGDSISRKPGGFSRGPAGRDAAAASATALLNDCSHRQAKTLFISPGFGRLRCEMEASCISAMGKWRPASFGQVWGAALSPRGIQGRTGAAGIALLPFGLLFAKGVDAPVFSPAFFFFLAKQRCATSAPEGDN